MTHYIQTLIQNRKCR